MLKRSGGWTWWSLWVPSHWTFQFHSIPLIDTVLAHSKLARADQIFLCIWLIEEVFHDMLRFYFIFWKEILTSNYCKLSSMYHVFKRGCDSSLVSVRSVLIRCCSWLWLTWSSLNGDTLFCLLRCQIVWLRLSLSMNNT